MPANRRAQYSAVAVRPGGTQRADDNAGAVKIPLDPRAGALDYLCGHSPLTERGRRQRRPGAQSAMAATSASISRRSAGWRSAPGSHSRCTGESLTGQSVSTGTSRPCAISASDM